MGAAPPPAGELGDEPDPDPDPAPGITGPGAPVHGPVEAPEELPPLETPFGAEGFEPASRLCLRWEAQWRWRAWRRPSRMLLTGAYRKS